MPKIWPGYAQDVPNTLLIYAHYMLKIQSPRLNHSQGWPVRDSVFSKILAQFGGGKKDGSPCGLKYVPHRSYIRPQYVSTLEKDGMTWTVPETRVTLVSVQCCNQTTKQPTNHANIEPLPEFHIF
jgi:hypothetical protein